MKVGVHFHGQLKAVYTEVGMKEITIVIKVDKKIVETLRKLDLLEESEKNEEIEVTIANE